MKTAAEIARSLSELERELLLGESRGWGSWMFGVGNDLIAKGLGTKRNGSIAFDTELAEEVIKALRHDRVVVNEEKWARTCERNG